MIKHLLAIATVFAATNANADGYASQTGVVVDVEAVYSSEYTPRTQEQCFEAQVPVYGNRQGSAADALTGAILGGVIGNQFGSGDGKDAMTALGAIVGANQAGGSSRGVVGYTYEWRCEMVHVEEETRSFHHYQVTYDLNGQYYRVNTDRLFEVGQRITIK